MGLRFRNATPGTILCAASTVLLAIVAFNTPVIKSLDFLSASYTAGSYSGELSLGTLGFCHTLSGTQNCTGPQVGYEFDPNDVFGVSFFDIPEAITRYLTYVLILHVVALGFSAIAMIVAILAHSPTFPLLCLSIWLAGIASTITFIALVFDLAMFYIAKARIDQVDGASSTIGNSVWITLAAWIILALSGCFFGIGNCCGICRDESRDTNRKRMDSMDDRAEEDYKMRMMAIDSERARKQQQEQGLPGFQEITPLKDESEEQYLIQHNALPVQNRDGGLGRNASRVSGVGVGYGRRNHRTPANDYAMAGGNGYGGWDQPRGYQNIQAPPPVARRLSDATSAGDFVGVGAGGGGVESSPPVPPLPSQTPAGGYGGPQNYYNELPAQGQYGATYAEPNQYGTNYADPYATQRSNAYDPYTQTTYNDPYVATPSNNYAAAPTAMPIPTPTATRSPPQAMPIAQPSGSSANPYGYNTTASSESYDPGPRVVQADPYDAYDDGLGAIGMAATTNTAGRHERDYTGQTFGAAAPIQVQEPRPQHLVGQNTARLLASPQSPVDQRHSVALGASGSGGGYGDELMNVSGSDNRPPSYSAGNYTAAPSGNEKSSYR
ncbi:hypothetical protein L198_05527 [Cryptococcus wingfieldii CBS 7118]|uniref:Pali-domain-containing protein n=1 Tax=Cryptococcus wingfieldii CBS 7118 TaxID=1295528 RepID=A0A1E3IVU1_9TREE|nr:hypothetical protein L198_05527 [Cryptococcus wingfieldii CBS 7118]ODN92733.1 hypothetical protein L198_05527 [Cryptococcus wingfieldii CBS 7118]